jgi:hypothetical protein
LLSEIHVTLEEGPNGATVEGGGEEEGGGGGVGRKQGIVKPFF